MPACRCPHHNTYTHKKLTPSSFNQHQQRNTQTKQLDKERLAAALEKQRRAQREAVETDERKRKFNSLGAGGDAEGAGDEKVTEEDMEAYRMVKARPDDPMARRERQQGGGEYDLLE